MIGSAATGYVGYLAEREFQIRRQARLLRKRANKVNIGSIFGMDVGGTLTKIVYFEKYTDSDAANEQRTDDGEEAYADMVTQNGGQNGRLSSVQQMKSEQTPDIPSSLKRAHTSAGSLLSEDQRERRTSLTGYEEKGGSSPGSDTRNTGNLGAKKT